MKRKYYLITNVSDCKYWSYLGTEFNTIGNHLEMVKKYGPIYINEYGGWMPTSCVKTIHQVVEQEGFPTIS
jgi:hypothetical protein